MQKTNRRELRVFAFIMMSGFLVLGAGIPLLKGKSIHLALVAIAVLFLLLGLLTPDLLEKPRRFWIWLGEKLGFINTRILFTFLYLTIFSFVHLVFMLTGRDRMKRKWKKYSSTYLEKTKISSFSDPF